MSHYYKALGDGLTGLGETRSYLGEPTAADLANPVLAARIAEQNAVVAASEVTETTVLPMQAVAAADLAVRHTA